jgi:4-amino-4-deoxy-L-arabinose transferase-like glycosyltransferase
MSAFFNCIDRVFNASSPVRFWGSIFVLALLLRLLYLSQSAFVPVGDMQAYDTIALNIATGQGFIDDQNFRSFRPPLYPALVALWYKICGHQFVYIALFQVLLSCCALLLLNRLATTLLGQPVARWAGVLYAVYPDFIVYPSLLLTETLYIFLVLAVFVVSLRTTRPRFTAWSIGEGLLVGLTVLVKPLFLIIYAASMVWSMVRSPGRRLIIFARTGLVLCLALLVVLPWCWRNSRLHHELVFIDTNTGVNAWIGNHPGATGEYQWPTGHNPLNDPALSEVERDRLGRRMVMQFVCSDAGAFLKLLAGKAIKFFQPVGELIFAFTPGLWQGKLFFLLSTLAYALVALGGLAGVLYAPRDRTLLPVVYLVSTSALYIVTTVGARYRLPLLPIVLIFTGYFLHQAPDILGQLFRRTARSILFYSLLIIESAGIVWLFFTSYAGQIQKFLAL